MEQEQMFWLVCNLKRNQPVFKHYSMDSARREAERLARLSPDDEFYVLAPVDKCKKIDVMWKKISDFDDFIPF